MLLYALSYVLLHSLLRHKGFAGSRGWCKPQRSFQEAGTTATTRDMLCCAALQAESQISAGSRGGRFGGFSDKKKGDEGPLVKICHDVGKLSAEQVKGLSSQVRALAMCALQLEGGSRMRKHMYCMQSTSVCHSAHEECVLLRTSRWFCSCSLAADR